MIRKLLLILFVASLACPQISTARAGEWTLWVNLHGRRLEGTPVVSSKSQILLLGRDGRYWDFAPSEPDRFGKASGRFASYSQSEMRSRLLRELGNKFDVTGTGHYLVAHPAGQRDLWAGRFEQLYRSFRHYFTARGFRPSEPRFPLVAIVFHQRSDYDRYAAKEGSSVGVNTLGYYSPKTNRVVMYDVTAGRSGGDRWQVNAATIIHEATHQTAYNTGVHRRMARAPLWLVEGLATSFESPGVYDSMNHRQRSERVNRHKLSAFRKYVASRRKPGSLADLIASDRPFRSNTGAAYAEAWALTHYLTETQPRQYSRYLAKIGARSPLTPYSRQQRTEDFTLVFGRDLTMIEARLLRYVQEIQ